MYKAIIAACFGLFLAFSVTACSSAESEECKALKETCDVVKALGDDEGYDECIKAAEESDICK
jgi:hypothetical protein